jgi:hypothetical protein
MRFTAGLPKGYVISSLAVLLTACGGGGVNGVSITGRVADGYINGAVVCLDVNDNKSCDSNEPSATSGAGGTFKLNPPSTLDLSTVRLIANVPATAIDEDTGAAVGTAYQMTSPANLSVVTPLTTLALSYKDQGQTWTQAVQSVKTNLGISDAQFKVDSDYVAEANVRTHNVAKLVAGVFQSNQITGSRNVGSIINGLSIYANTAFSSSTIITSSALANLIEDGANATRTRIFASDYIRTTGLTNFLEGLNLQKEGNTNSNTGIFGVSKSTGDPWYWSGDLGVVPASNNNVNGTNFYWGTNMPFPGGYIESWVMEPTGFDIFGMRTMDVKIWGPQNYVNSPRFTPVLESLAIDGCYPQAKSTALTAPAIYDWYQIVDQASAQFRISLDGFEIIETCSGAVTSMNEFISRPLRTVRIRVYQENAVSGWNGINLGPISFGR